ncbi:Dopamine beta-hydroxylase, partial [Armadillidium nasatum]
LRLPSHPKIYDVPLDINDTLHLYWQVDYETESVRIEIHSRAFSPHPWVAVGFSDRGEFPGSDMCVFWVDWKKKIHFQNAERGTTHIVWAWGLGPLYSLEGVIAKGDYCGEVKLELLKPALPDPNLENSKELLVRANKVSVPSDETTYWCSVQKLPEEFIKKHHMLKFGPRIEKGNEDVVHHMEVFHCEHPPNFEVPLYQG